MRTAITRRVAALPAAAALAVVWYQASGPVLGQHEVTTGSVSAPGVTVVTAAPDVPLHNPHLPVPGEPPRNADGHPDLNGMWDFSVGTPLERPPDFGDRLFMTDEEAVAFSASLRAVLNTDLETPGALLDATAEGINEEEIEHDVFNRGMNDVWFDLGKQPPAQNRSSLIVDPPDGRLPPFTPEAQARMARCTGIYECGMKGWGPSDRSGIVTDVFKAEDVRDRSIAERCLVIGQGPPIEVFAYNNNLHIFQSSDVVVIETEMIHTARVVYLDGRPQPDASVQQWHGYSRGHWEGDTLIIETTNFRPDAWWIGVLHPERFTLVERLTRIDADTILYEYTVNDPETWTQPWTAQIPMKRLDGYMYEYACHEGNYAIRFQLMANRRLEQQQAAAQGK